MKRNLLKLALCAMTALPLGAWADATPSLATRTTIVFDNIDAGTYKHTSNQEVTSNNFSYAYGTTDGTSIVVTALDPAVSETVGGMSFTANKSLKLNGTGVLTYSNTTKRTAGSNLANGTFAGSVAFNTDIAGTVYVYAKGSALHMAYEYQDAGNYKFNTTSKTGTDISSDTPAEFSIDVPEATTVVIRGNATIYAIGFIPYAKVSIGATGYATYSNNTDLHFDVPSGLTAYKAKPATSTITLTSLDGLPAKTAVVFKGTPSSEYKLTASASTYEISGNYMSRVSSDFTLPQTQEKNSKTYYNYILASDGGVAKFFQPDGTSTIAAGKAYFSSTTNFSAAGARGISIIFEDDETTGIISTKTEKGDDSWYTLQGVKVAQPTKGIYVKNGKKVVVK